MCWDSVMDRFICISCCSCSEQIPGWLRVGLIPTWVTRSVRHPASVGWAAWEVHQDHGGRALRHDDGGAAAGEREELPGVEVDNLVALLPPPPPLPLPGPPAPPLVLPGSGLVPGRSFLLLRHRLAPTSFPWPRILKIEKYFACPVWCGHSILLS